MKEGHLTELQAPVAIPLNPSLDLGMKRTMPAGGTIHILRLARLSPSPPTRLPPAQEGQRSTTPSPAKIRLNRSTRRLHTNPRPSCGGTRNINPAPHRPHQSPVHPSIRPQISCSHLDIRQSQRGHPHHITSRRGLRHLSPTTINSRPVAPPVPIHPWPLATPGHTTLPRLGDHKYRARLINNPSRQHGPRWRRASLTCSVIF